MGFQQLELSIHGNLDHPRSRWVQEEAIVDVSDYGRLSIMARARMGHIHENGVCKKNRYGPHYGVDNDPQVC